MGGGGDERERGFFLSVEREKPRVTAMDGESPMNICGQRHHA